MKRLKKMVLLSHCILNQNAVVFPLARSKGGFTDIVYDYMSRDYGIYQLPCPELKYLGMTRQPMTKEEYNSEAYIKLCKQLVEEVMTDLKKYREIDVSIDILHGIQESPTCSISQERGHFMTYLIAALEVEQINTRLVEVPPDYET